jgi:hypothetical protein
MVVHFDPISVFSFIAVDRFFFDPFTTVSCNQCSVFHRFAESLEHIVY